MTGAASRFHASDVRRLTTQPRLARAGFQRPPRYHGPVGETLLPGGGVMWWTVWVWWNPVVWKEDVVRFGGRAEYLCNEICFPKKL